VGRFCCGWLALALLVGSACRAADSRSLDASFTEPWNKTYPLSEGGEVQIVGGQGFVEVIGGPGNTVEVRAERIAKAATEATAKDVAPRIAIREDIAPDKIVLTSEGLSGIVIGVEQLINYRVTVPQHARVRVRTGGGAITVSGVNGRVAMNSANGPIEARSLGGGVEARGVNQNVTIDLAAFGDQPVEIRAVNASARLTMPAGVNATLTATTVNGKIDLGAFSLEPIGEQTGRRVRGQLGSGGPPIEVHAVNGSVTITPRP
jgi:hypothetical protein